MRWEAQHSCPFPQEIADVEKTMRLRAGPVKADQVFANDEIAVKREVGYGFARAFLVDNVRKLSDLGRSKRPEGLPDHRGLPVDKSARLALFARSADDASFTNLALTLAPKDWVNDEKRFCLSAEWMTWQYLRLIDIVLREYSYLSQIGGFPGEERAEHDYQDLGYVSLLSRADAIITRDGSLD